MNKGTEELKGLSLFVNLDWKALSRLEINPPLSPQMRQALRKLEASRQGSSVTNQDVVNPAGSSHLFTKDSGFETDSSQFEERPDFLIGIRMLATAQAEDNVSNKPSALKLSEVDSGFDSSDV